MIKQRIILIIVLALAGTCLTGVALYYGSQWVNTFYSRPLVLIQNPFYMDKVQVGQGQIVHATARASSAIDRMELWADGVFVADEKIAQNINATQFVLSTAWTPGQPGSYTLTVRAFTRNGVEGQASVVVEGVGSSEADDTPTHVVQEGETVESISADNGITPEDLTSYNPDLGPGGLQPGDTVDVPGNSPEEEELTSPESVAPSDESAPSPAAEPPASISPLEMFFFLQPLIEPINLFFQALPFHGPPVPVFLHVEALRLETRDPYELLHCYLSMAGGDPGWFPDADHNQSTDESFTSQWGGRLWNIKQYMTGKNVPVVSWMDDRALPFDITCVGVAGGGDEAVDLGRVHIAAQPESWGRKVEAVSTGGEGFFKLMYRVSKVDAADLREKGPDANMTGPTNVRVNIPQSRLLWDYNPREDESPIDGFAVLLNGTLQWTEPADARQSRLPPEWTTPPCGDEYIFSVVAFYGSYPEGTYSDPPDSATIAGGEAGDRDCSQSVMVTFVRLTTNDLGEDGRYDPGDMGAIYGTFFANDAQVTFNGVHDDFGINNNSWYNISTIMSDYGSGQPRILLDLPAGDPNVNDVALWVGFEIWDNDTGWHSSDDKVCSGDTRLDENDLAGTFSGVVETDNPVAGIPDRCFVAFTVEPVGDRPVVDPGAPPPLPDLEVENITIEPNSGQFQIHVRNVGTAAWAGKDIDVRLSTPSGEDLGVFSWPNVTIAPNERRILVVVAALPHPVLAACVLLDPDNKVEELIDRYTESGMLAGRGRFCRPLPDLTISEAEYNSVSNQLVMTVHNDGERTPLEYQAQGSLENSNLTVWMTFEDGRPLTRDWQRVTIDSHGNYTLLWPLNDAERARMLHGYTLVLDPNNDIAETNDDNNEYEVFGTTRLRLVWSCGWVDFCVSGSNLLGGKNTWDMHLTGTVSGGGRHRTVADWNSPEVETTWAHGNEAWCKSGLPFISDWFDVAGDEVLYVSRTAGLSIVGHGYRWFSGGVDTLNAANNFGGVTIIPENTDLECFSGQVPCGYDWGAGGGVGCQPLRCAELGDEGRHPAGTIYASGDGINGVCYWTTTYGLYQAGE